MDNFFDTSKMFNGLFGKIQPGMCRLSMNGGIAIKCSNGYKTYNVKKQRLTNVTNFCVTIPGMDLFFVIPTNKVSRGDIILVDGKPKCVIENEGTTIKVIDYENSEIRQIVPERHVFMGNTYFYGKIVSLMGNNFKNGNSMKSMMKMMMMSQILGGVNGNNANNAEPMAAMMPMMMMSQMFSGDDNIFDGMLDDVNFGVTDSDDNEEEE